MTCAGRVCVYAILFGVLICTQSITVFGKDGKEGKDLKKSEPETIHEPEISQFQWSEHNKLSWNDFRGPVNAASDECAAATHCGIGFRTTNTVKGEKPLVTVYNTFYVNKSWVRSDAKIPEILEHEQGHFDLCELYTRKLKDRIAAADYAAGDVKVALMNIYNEVSQEYENRQQAYERETTHGINIPEQKKWCATISRELSGL